MNPKLTRLRQLITENLRIQRGGGSLPTYIDVSHSVVDVTSKQNHAIFARRGCGKTLLLHYSSSKLAADVRPIYLNCEDFKHHSFPNVLIEVLDALFSELESHLSGWFGRKKKTRDLIQDIRKQLADKRAAADLHREEVRQVTAVESEESETLGGSFKARGIGASASSASNSKARQETDRSFKVHSSKIKDLDAWLPRLKTQLRQFFTTSKTVKAVILQIDDFYHLKRVDQPFVVDYIHRLCKDLPLYFKIATLRHASNLYADRAGQPIGAQERHDYQPIDIDFTFRDFARTRDQNRQILHAFGRMAEMYDDDVDALFKGEGFDRLVMAGGGVPRDTLSLFLEVLTTVQAQGGDRIGKDDVRVLSRSNLERRVQELKQDSEGGEQDTLMRGIYVLREFCLSKQTNVFLVSEQMLQQRDEVRDLINRLLDYRIIHNAAAALTHKSQSGTYQAFAIDIGCYAHLRKLDGKFAELDISRADAKERMRSAPILAVGDFDKLWQSVPRDVEHKLLVDAGEQGDAGDERPHADARV